MASATQRITSLFLSVLLMAACGDRGEQANAERVRSIADRYVAAYFGAWPEEATFAGVSDATHDGLSDNSPEARGRWEATADSILDDLSDIDASSLPAAGASRVTHGFLLEMLRNSKAFRVCRMELWNVSPTWTGWQSGMAVLANSQPVGTPEKNEAAVRRFSALPAWIDQEISNLRRGLTAGYSAPKVNVEAVLRQMDALLGAQVDESPFVQMAPDSFPEFRERMREVETTSIRPAIIRYRDFLRNEYLAAARDDIAVAAIPDGSQCYSAAIRYHSTVDIGAEQVHETGKQQMDSIRAQMAVIAERSFGTRDVGEVLNRLRTDRRYLLSGRDEKMKVARDAVERARAAVPRYFGLLPKSEVVVEPVPAFNEASAPDGFYNNPAEDGSRPGIYYINLYRAETNPRAGLESTAFHETYPGHHLQSGLALERLELHALSRYFFLSGFGEGWALYSERLADEMGLFTSDVDRLGMLSAQAMRAARLVVDAGMHALGWSRRQAIDYMLANTAESEDAVSSEIDRYIAVPGQATSYMLGALEISALRREAEATLGSGFDIKQFHDRVLEDGAVPLSMLRAKIQAWIAASR
jgi:uncharacterized protein (DUF885 family)